MEPSLRIEGGDRGGLETRVASAILVRPQVAQAHYVSPEQHYSTELINFSYDNGYKTLYENYPISP